MWYFTTCIKIHGIFKKRNIRWFCNIFASTCEKFPSPNNCLKNSLYCFSNKLHLGNIYRGERGYQINLCLFSSEMYLIVVNYIIRVIKLIVLNILNLTLCCLFIYCKIITKHKNFSCCMIENTTIFLWITS